MLSDDETSEVDASGNLPSCSVRPLPTPYVRSGRKRSALEPTNDRSSHIVNCQLDGDDLRQA